MTTVTKASVELAELGKFFAVTGRRLAAGETVPQMFSGAVDAVWHMLIGDPDKHLEFTIAYAGRPLAHAESKGEGLISWVTGYEETYGPLPEVWFTAADGTVNTQALARYRESGQVWAEWDCSPAPGDGDDLVPEMVTA